MKLHHGQEPIEVPHDPELINYLIGILATSPRPMAIVETGTYLGTGTTEIVAKAVNRMMLRYKFKKRPKMYTIEASYKNYVIAKQNLEKYKWIEAIHGCSLDIEECCKFIKNDKAILEHEKYPDLFIDSNDPVSFYTREIRGRLFENDGPKGRENVLRDLMPEVWSERPLFILDSAGGIGFLEFQKVVVWMGNSRYFVFLDDNKHLKHFRSVAYVRECNWPIIAEDPNGRWLLVLHPGEPGRPKQ